MIIESTGFAQVEELVVSTDAEDSARQTSKAKPSIMKSVPVAIISKATTVTVLEVPVTASMLMDLLLALSLQQVRWLSPLRTLYAQS